MFGVNKPSQIQKYSLVRSPVMINKIHDMVLNDHILKIREIFDTVNFLHGRLHITFA